ncbi:MAG: signal peptidase [Sphingomonas bacterium]|uniref:signal peptidase I n=1 Tax=Sphingomonas bacterium TaxID=1895847 RepID=UPI0026208810|nr:signal peptidase I [Sphingomonas bacterium]MDB5694492.1 signal peptidase [Sphingomonas bacterium]
MTPTASDAAVPEVQTATPDDQPAKIDEARRGTDWWGEIKGIFWLLLVVLGFHSFIAKPFYIPSESMLPGMLVGDRLVVTKFAYGWSFVSPTIPNPAAIFRSAVLRQPGEGWTVGLPFTAGRILGRVPTRGDVVIVTPPGTRNDYIKRVVGLPGDTLEVRGGVLILNGKPVPRGPMRYVDLPVDANSPCTDYPGAVRLVGGSQVCHLPVVTETLPNGRRYDTVDLEPNSTGDNFGPIRIPANHVFLMGDNRDRSADSRFGLDDQGLGGPVPYENIGGRAEFITFSLDGTTSLNPISWFTSLRGGRAGTSLHAEETK